ncbi:retrovirus-related Pol polyprotein from transposon 17.6 [Trichonephila clavipes]|nr:retrovirus-related Pol polyprotein from transposon 17.6 [Trichonephila clavipes]
MGNKIIEALIDSSSSVSLIRRCKQRNHRTVETLERHCSIDRTGEVRSQNERVVQRKIELDGEEYSLTWHVVPTPSLEFQAVIGSDILEQASVCFYKESVQFRKHEDKNCFLQMQVYEAEVED